jgi:hypothetical protein
MLCGVEGRGRQIFPCLGHTLRIRMNSAEYPASSVLRTSPSPQTAQPDSREVPVDPDYESPPGLPVLRLVPSCIHAVANTPAGPMKPSAHTLHRHQPSPKFGRVGSCIASFEACSAFTLITACTLAKSPKRPSTPKASATSLPLPLLRLLPGGANQFPGGIRTHCWTSAFHGAPNMIG